MGIMEKKMETIILGLNMYPISPFLGTLDIRCRITKGNQKGTIILTTTPRVPFKACLGRSCSGLKVKLAKRLPKGPRTEIVGSLPRVLGRYKDIWGLHRGL